MNSTDKPIVDVEGLTKRFQPDSPPAVTDLSLQLRQGEIFGFVGPNGAGKTTTIKMFLNLIHPDSGGGSIFGMDIVKDSVAIRQRVAFMSGEVQLYKNMTGNELLDFILSLHKGGDKGMRENLSRRFDVPLHRKTKSYSAGQKQQLALIAALSHKADLLILDEPTKGLDPSRKRDILDIILERGGEGAGVVISSHVLSEIESICTRVGFIRQGVLLGQEEIAAVQQRLANLIVVTFDQEVETDRLAVLSGVNEVHRRGKEYILTVADDGRAAVKQLADMPINSLRYRHATLDDLYESLYFNNDESRKGAGMSHDSPNLRNGESR